MNYNSTKFTTGERPNCFKPNVSSCLFLQHAFDLFYTSRYYIHRYVWIYIYTYIYIYIYSYIYIYIYIQIMRLNKIENEN